MFTEKRVARFILNQLSAVTCDVKNDTYYFCSTNSFAIFNETPSAYAKVLCGVENNAGNKDGDFSNARFYSIVQLTVGNKSIYALQKRKSTYGIRKADLIKKEVSTVLEMRPLNIKHITVSENDDLWLIGETGVFRVIGGGLYQVNIERSLPSHIFFDDISQTLILIRSDAIHLCHIDPTANSDNIPRITVIRKPLLQTVACDLDMENRKLYFVCPPKLFMLDLTTNTLHHVMDSKLIATSKVPKLSVTMEGHLSYWDMNCSVQINTPRMPWKLARILWIGKYKNSYEDCPWSLLPREIIREIIQETRY